ncbi:MAG: UDP-glucose/GDP-mannose dehydrogenase family protein [Terriglobales bacterium]
MNIAVVGSGYVGLVAGACFAELGHNVELVDNDPIKYQALANGQCPIHEAYLPELLAKHRGGRLSFSSTLAEPVHNSQAIFVAVGTPPAVNGEADLSYVEAVAREIASAVNDYKVVICKSTVPVYTSDWVRKVLLLNGAPANLFDVGSNPEFLREGTAVTDFLYPERIVIGTNTLGAANVLREIYKPMLDGSYYQRADAIPAPPSAKVPPPLIATSTKSAELIKYASNAFLAMKISFINAVATVCESVGADVDDVREGIGTDTRIGPRFLYPGIGYGGSCFPKDLSAYRAVARECGYDFRLLEEVMRINEEQRHRFLRKVRGALWTIKGKRLGVLGLAFKGGTDDVRESPAISIIESLLEEGAEVRAYDPAAIENAKQVLPQGAVTYAASAYDAIAGADALLVLTEWEEFKELDFARVRQLLRYPIVIDGRNLFDPQIMREHGFIYLSIGRPDVVPSEEKLRARAAGARENKP